jgi:hypothetical protein
MRNCQFQVFFGHLIALTYKLEENPVTTAREQEKSTLFTNGLWKITL